jgi:hypothetical protein
MSDGFTDIGDPERSKPDLKAVDRLEFTILVDNSIEWMTKMPPGFSSEVQGHLKRGPPVDSARTGIPILDLDNYCCGGCLLRCVTGSRIVTMISLILQGVLGLAIVIVSDK